MATTFVIHKDGSFTLKGRINMVRRCKPNATTGAPSNSVILAQLNGADIEGHKSFKLPNEDGEMVTVRVTRVGFNLMGKPGIADKDTVSLAGLIEEGADA